MENARQTDEIGNEWLKKLKEWTTTEYAPISKDDTRKQGRQLVLASFASILLSLHYFTLLTININGFVLKANSEYILLIVVNLICLYLLVLYCIDMYADWKSPSNISYHEIRNILVKEWYAIECRGNKLAEEIDQKLELRKRNYQELGLGEQLSKPSTHKDLDIIQEEINTQMEEFSERIKRSNMFDEYCKNDGLCDLQKDLDAIAFVQSKEYEARFKGLLSITKSVYRVRLCRFLLEVVFPIAIALFSFYKAIGYFY